jgi:hypothetical protein
MWIVDDMRLATCSVLVALASVVMACSGVPGEEPGDETSDALESGTLTIRPDQVVAPSFEGFGTQYNQNLFATISEPDGVTPARLGTLEKKLGALSSGYVRIFFDAGAPKDEQDSFLRTVALAQKLGARVNVTYWHGPYKNVPAQMKVFADALQGVLASPGAVDVTLQNEVNTTPCVTQEVYASLYVALDGELRARALRSRVRFIGGDLLRGGVSADEPEAFQSRVDKCVKACGWTPAQCADKAQADGSTEEAWLADFASRTVQGVPGATYLSDMFEGYSAHVYWNYWDRNKMTARLDGLQKAIDALPARARRPLYITEFGAKGDYTKVLSPGVYDGARPAKDADGHTFLASEGYPIADTAIEGFQTGRFAVEALKRGVVAALRWDAFDAHYQTAPAGDFSMLEKASTEWAPTPSFPVMQLLGEAAPRGWKVVGVDGDDRAGLVAAALAGGASERSLFVVNDTAAVQKLVMRGFAKDATVRVLQWMRSDGTARTVRTVKTGSLGGVTVDVPMHAVVAVTSLKG